MILEDIIKQLETRFSDKLPDKEVTPYQLGYLIGQQAVINYLHAFNDNYNKPPKKK